MASLLKNQILKHLSKFTKNLSPDKISLSTLRGEGELCNLELDEYMLTELLDLPTWLKITKATVNKVSVKIQWTKLKSQPICLVLDKVVVETETCDEPRPPNNPAHLASYRSGGTYGFIDRVIDGIFVHVESVEVRLLSKAFHASLQLLRLRVQSTTPAWQATPDLRHTRIRDAEHGEILLFKEIEWQNMKIEANAVETDGNQDIISTPLRLLANQAKIRITMKKRLSDCSIISSRVMLLLDDLLWVLTATQLKAAILYSKSLKELIERSAKQSKELAAEKLQKQGHIRTHSDQHRPQQHTPQHRAGYTSTAANFAKCDVSTTSYHLITSRIDLHLCDDSLIDRDVKAERTWNTENGSMQVTMYRLSVDYYPFHPAGGERKQWHRYTDNIGSRNPWVQKLFTTFREEVLLARKAFSVPSPTQQHPNRSPQHMSAINQTKPVPAGSGQPPRSPQGSLIQPKRPKSTRLLESCFVMKLEDFTMYMVSTPENKRTGHHKVFASDKKQLHLPSDMSVLHLEYTDYFFPEGLESPVPHANLYILLNPVRLMIDYLTLLWFNYFLLSLSKNVGQDMEGNNSPEHIDIKIEAVMPRVIVPAESKVEGQPDRPEYMQLQISRLCATNTRVEEKTTKEDLKSVLESYENVQLLKKKEFPNDSECQMIPKHFEAHVCDTDNPYIDKSVKNILSKASKGEIIVEGSEGAGEYSLITNTLKREAVCDIWCVVLDQVWLEFLGALNARTRPQPFVETFPASLWICAPSLSFRVPNQTPVTVVNANCTPTQSDHPNSTNDLHPVSNGVKDKRPDRLHIKQYYNCDVIDYTHSKGHNSTFCDSKKINSHECQGVGKKGERLQYRDNCLADFHVIAKVGAKIRIQLNHFQYLFMMRFSESVTKFQTQLQADFQRLGAEGSSSFCVPLIIPQIEFATVCPCLVHQKCFPDDLGSPVSPEDKQPDLPMEEKNFNAEEFPTIEFGEVSPLEGIDSDRGLPGDSHNSPNILITKSMSDSTIQSHSNGSIGHQSDTSTEYERNANVPLQRTSISALAISGHPDDRDSSISSGSLGVDSGISMDSRRGVLRNAKPQKGADMKKAISSAFSSFTDKLKIKSDGSEDTLSASDDLETMSVKTDLSSDEEFEHLNFDDLEAPVFCHDPPSETASTTDTYSDMADDLSSVYAESLSIRGKEIISIVLFKLDKTEVVIQSTGDQMTIGAQVASLSTCQPGNISSEDFHTKFSHSKGFIQDNTVAAGAPKVFPIKFLYTATSSPGSPDDIFMTIKAKDVSLSFKMSSLTSLADFIEDEKIPDPIPMSVDVRNLLLILEEDRPSVNPMSPGAVPVDLQIHKIMIRRGMDGVFHFSGGSMESAQGLESLQSLQGMENLSNSSDNISLKTGLTSMEMDTEKEDTPVPLLAPLRQLQTDNFKLKAQVQELLAMQKTNEKELKEMREALQLQKTDRDIEVENFKLQQRIVVLEEDLQISLKEKDSLLATLRLLQEDLMASEQRFRSRTTTS